MAAPVDLDCCVACRLIAVTNRTGAVTTLSSVYSFSVTENFMADCQNFLHLMFLFMLFYCHIFKLICILTALFLLVNILIIKSVFRNIFQFY